jgi:hypothetical protein
MLKIKNIKINTQRALFVVASFLFIIEMNGPMLFSSISKISLLLNALFSILYIVYAMFFILYESGRLRNRSYLVTLLAAIVLIFAMVNSYDLLFLGSNTYPLTFETTLTFGVIPLYLPIILFIFLGVNLIRQKFTAKYRHRARAIALLMFAGALIMIFILFFSRLFGAQFGLDDEEFLTLHAATALANGHNPYTENFSAVIYNAYESNSVGLPTSTTNNMVVGGVNYPALSFLVSVPFALATKLGIFNFTGTGLTVDVAIFIFIMIFSIAYILKPEHIRYPPIPIILFILISISLLSSFTNFLMFAVIILAFYWIDSKYVWILLGIAASLQEELWVAVILFLVYAFRNHGVARGTYTLLGTALVFLAINGYFIAIGPSAYISNVFTPVNGYVLPSAYAIIGYMVLILYPLTLNAINYLFYAAILSVVIIFAYFNEKNMIFLLAFVPFLFLYHAISPYFNFFVAALIVSLYARDRTAIKTKAKSKARPARLRSQATGNSPVAALAAITLIVIIIAITSALVIQAHKKYEAYGISVSDPRLAASANYTFYNATIAYSDTNLTEISIIMYGMYRNGTVPAQYGILDQGRILYSPFRNNSNQTNSTLSYKINPNILYLNSSSGSINFSTVVPSNAVNIVDSAECVMYFGSFYYTCPKAAIGAK